MCHISGREFNKQTQTKQFLLAAQMKEIFSERYNSDVYIPPPPTQLPEVGRLAAHNELNKIVCIGFDLSLFARATKTIRDACVCA